MEKAGKLIVRRAVSQARGKSEKGGETKKEPDGSGSRWGAPCRGTGRGMEEKDRPQKETRAPTKTEWLEGFLLVVLVKSPKLVVKAQSSSTR